MDTEASNYTNGDKNVPWSIFFFGGGGWTKSLILNFNTLFTQKCEFCARIYYYNLQSQKSGFGVSKTMDWRGVNPQRLPILFAGASTP